MEIVKSHLEKNETDFSTDLEKKWAKSVQLVNVSFFLSDFLQNPYFNHLFSGEWPK